MYIKHISMILMTIVIVTVIMLMISTARRAAALRLEGLSKTVQSFVPWFVLSNLLVCVCVYLYTYIAKCRLYSYITT